MKVEVLRYVKKNGFAYVRSAKILCRRNKISVKGFPDGDVKVV
jgi:hypothetical protein